jgi:anti-sigma factor RsiW
MHATEAMLVDYTDGELGRADGEWVTRHVKECSSCHSALDELRATRSTLVSLLTEMDHAEPAWPQDLQLIYGERVAAVPVTRGKVAPAVWRWAAGIVLFSGAATALAVVRSIGLDADSERAPAPAARTTPATSAARAASGVLVEAVDGVVEIELREAAPGTRITVTFESGQQVGIRTQGNVNPSFVAQRGRVEVQLHGAAAELGLTLSPQLPLLRISTRGEVVALVERGVIRIVSGDAGIIVESGER